MVNALFLEKIRRLTYFDTQARLAFIHCSFPVTKTKKKRKRIKKGREESRKEAESQALTFLFFFIFFMWRFEP